MAVSLLVAVAATGWFFLAAPPAELPFAATPPVDRAATAQPGSFASKSSATSSSPALWNSIPTPISRANVGTTTSPLQPPDPDQPDPPVSYSTQASPATGNLTPQNSTPSLQTADEVAAFFSTTNSRDELLTRADLSNPLVRKYVVARLSEIEEFRYEAVLAEAARRNIPVRLEGPGHKVSILYDFRDGAPLYRSTLNANAAISSAASLIRQTAPYNLDGSGVKVGVWDAGSVRNTHREFNTTRVVRRNSSVAFDAHATHVAGTIGANGTTTSAKGMAPLVAIDSYDWNNDYAEMTADGAATATETNKIPASNHSYGYNAVTSDMGRYNSESVTTDNLAQSLPYYLIFWAAGNEQDELTAKLGYQSITFNGLAKNILTVGAVNDAVTSGQRDLSKATMSSFSSWGPADDGRIKPDVVANGVSVYSPVSSGDSAYDTYSGTSMATPSAAGSAALLVQLYAREFSNQRLRASMLKALLIHTADDLGTPGPDYKNGWGLINVKAAADLILAHKASLAAPKMIEGTLSNSTKSATHTLQWDGTSPIRATLCWTEPAGTAQADNSRAPNLRHNLDLEIITPNGVTILPFVMPFVGNWTDSTMALAATRGKNNVDNVEQVLLAAPGQSGTYTVTVSLSGNLTTANQTYSLILTGGANVQSNPPPSVTLDSPPNGTAVLSNSPINITATATDQTIGGGNGTVQSVQFFSGNTSLGIDTTAPYSVSWTPTTPGTYQITALATDTEGASANSTPLTVFVLAGNGAPTINSFSPSSGRISDNITITGTNFAALSSVSFNGTAAQFTANSTTSLTAIVPAGSSSGPITITNSFGSVISSANFTLLESPVLISQIYGGGGNAGAPFNADFVELHNRSSSTINLSGWSIQYASASGNTWQSTALTGSIAPGKFHLIKLAGGSNGANLPTADTTGTINLSATNGKVALRDSTTSFTGASPVGQSGLQDFVGYGTATAYEGSGAAPSPSTTTSIFRLGGGTIDSGNNSSDFTTGTPNPRNTSFGSPTAPAITSPLTTSGTLGQFFSYQITASNSPTTFNATNLPAGLTINPSTGLISGIPAATGTTNTTISATNAIGTGQATLTISITQSGGGGQVLFDEDFSSITSGNNTSTSGSGTTWSGNANFPNVTNAFQAGGAVRLGSSSNAGSITTRPLNLSAGAYNVTLKVKGWTTVEGDITVTPSGGSPQTVSYTGTMSGPFETKTLTFNAGSSNATITIATTAKRAFLDDVVITTSSPTPSLTANNTLTALSTTYGLPSASSTFTISGTNLTSDILVTAPPGFEISQTANGTSGYAPTQTIGSNGSVGPVTLHLRLPAGITADSYAGSIICSSPGANTVTLSVPTSTVRPKLLTITAADRSKTFGQTLILGTSAFTASGLVGNETISAVTLTSSGGTAATDPAGTYEITPSNATGGTFSPFNYDLDYQPGTLTVLPATYTEWTALFPALGTSSPLSDFDGDLLPNLTEFYLGLDPTQPSPNPFVIELSSPTELSLTYARSKSATGTTGRIESSPALGADALWTPLPPANDTLLSENATHEIRRASAPIPPSEKKIFLRLHVTTP